MLNAKEDIKKQGKYEGIAVSIDMKRDMKFI
jgi:hypothetical protein